MPVGVAVKDGVGDGWLLGDADALGVGLGVGEDGRDGVCVGGVALGALVGDNEGLGEREGGAIDGVRLGLNPEAMLEMGPLPPAHAAARGTKNTSASARSVAFMLAAYDAWFLRH
jgi:hypothetical protein